jgi:fatty-acyl-CoA synthase
MKMNFSRVMSTMALRFRDNLAVVNVERDRRYTYAEYHRLTNRIAHMMRHALGLGAGDKALLILENDNLSLLHFPAIYKQPATVVFSNLRDSPEEQARQIDHVKPKLVFIETRLVAQYRDLLAGRGCLLVAMDRSPDLPRDVPCFWDLVEAASEADNDVELDVHEHISHSRRCRTPASCRSSRLSSAVARPTRSTRRISPNGARPCSASASRNR